MAFSPLPAQEFDTPKAAHLLWRAGFGGTWADAEELAGRGLDGAIEWLLAPAVEKPGPLSPPECAKLPEEDEAAFRARLRSLPDGVRQKLANERRREENNKIEALKRWWLERMLTTRRPLEEKLTLFWHSHFASSFAEKIEHAYPMWRQNERFRRFAFGKFPDQLKALIRDPAMLVWLDNAQSRSGRPNENFARELMELFSLGVGHYSETDVKESARALTGFGVDRDTWKFAFHKDAHDPGEKVFLGNTGDWTGDDIVQIISEHPAASRFMTRKFLEFFLWPNPETPLVEEAARIYREVDLALAPFLRHLFASREFYSPRALAATVKSPVVLTLGALKSMRVPIPESSTMIDALRLMGQDLFFPPDVNGWPGGMAWINSNVLLIRYNFGNFLINGVSPDDFQMYDSKQPAQKQTRRTFIEKQRSVNWSPKAQIKALGLERKLNSPGEAVDFYVRDFLQRPISPEFRRQLVALLETDAAGGRKSFSFDDNTFDERIRGLVHLIMSSPDYQLC